MRRLVVLLVAVVAFVLFSGNLFGKGRSSASRRSPSTSGTGSKTPHATTKKSHVMKGNYNPNTGKRAMKIAR